MPILYIMCGLVGSGKSTEVKKLINAGKTFCVCRDALRTMLGAGGYVLNKDVTEPAIKEVVENLSATLIGKGLNVVVDETNLTISKRAGYIKIAEDCGAIPIIVWCKESERNLDNRMNDDPRGYTREKWESVIEGMKASFEPPTGNECDIIEIAPWPQQYEAVNVPIFKAR